VALASKGDPVPSFDARVQHKAGRRIRINVSTLVIPNGPTEGPVTALLFRRPAPAWDRPGISPEPGPEAASSPVSRLLTPRESEIVRLLATGATSRAVAQRLNVSTATVRNHVQHILAKLGAHSRLEVVAHVLRHGLP
jgi:DNA-binding CsgD family transcriptional regulator